METLQYLNDKYTEIVTVTHKADKVMPYAEKVQHKPMPTNDERLIDLYATLDAAIDYYHYTQHSRWIVIIACIIQEIEEYETSIDKDNPSNPEPDDNDLPYSMGAPFSKD